VRRWVLVLAVGGVLGLPVAARAAAPSPPGFVLSTKQPGGKGFAPAFVGNGYLAGRQPAAGQGFDRVLLEAGGKHLATQSEVQGLYAKTTKKDEGLIERRAALPAWSRLDVDDGSGRFLLGRGTVRGYRQRLDLHTGTLTTHLTWTSRAHRTMTITYTVTPDRAHPHAALVRLEVTPRASGPLTVTDVLDGQAAEHVAPVARGQAGRRQHVDLRTLGLGVRATVASVLVGPGPAPRAVTLGRNRLTAAQRVTVDARAGKTYTFTKYVGVAVSTDATPGSAAARLADPRTRALDAAAGEATRGYGAARAASDAAWARLWRADIQVSGDARLRRQVRSALFALFASVRDDTPWAPSPGGLSSDGYNGHVFWDSETWMYPSLLATAPRLARAMLQYRIDRLGAARRYARATGFRGARFPWESALTGSEETPSCCNTGKYEVHVTADVALALWQYWLATGDRAWLATHAWPTLAAIADFWVSRSRPNPDGSRSIDDVIGADDYHERVDDSVYTNVAARDALRIAGQAAAITGHPADPQWAAVAGALRIPFDPAKGVHPEFFRYTGDTIKQADVALLAYPWENDQPAAVTQADLDHYVPRVDPDGPSMTDAIHAILTSQLGTPGCAAYTFTKRSVDPFMRGPYEQFAEARTGGAFTFTTGAGGFLQEFLYGYSGWRWRGDRIRLDPSLPPQLTGVVLRSVSWHGRTLRVAIGRQDTTVSLLHGRAVAVEAPGATATLQPGQTLTIPTRRPDAAPTDDAARCRAATATPATAEPPQAAVDGTRASSWLAEAPGTRLQVDLGAAVPLGAVELTRPDVLAIATGKTDTHDHARTGPTRSAGETVAVSADGRTWQTLARVAAPPVSEAFAGDGRPVRFVRVTAAGNASKKRPLVIGELAVHRRAG
jgi:trehalose/maltose hydrolase-like predicted phosphorylase